GKLKDAGFIDKSSDIESFKLVFACNCNSNESIKPIKWIVLTKQNKGYNTSKRALLELLYILKVSFEQRRNKKLLRS
ncbi:MAG: hypothetical protein RR499_03910, partial [Mucinivorans sp.]